MSRASGVVGLRRLRGICEGGDDVSAQQIAGPLLVYVPFECAGADTR